MANKIWWNNLLHTYFCTKLKTVASWKVMVMWVQRKLCKVHKRCTWFLLVLCLMCVLNQLLCVIASLKTKWILKNGFGDPIYKMMVFTLSAMLPTCERTSLLLELTFFQIKKVSLCLALFCANPTVDNSSLYVTIEREKSFKKEKKMPPPPNPTLGILIK